MPMKTSSVLISRSQIADRVRELAMKITQDYSPRLKANESLLVVSVLKGSFVFAADLVRQLNLPCEIDFIEASSYGAGTQSSGDVKILKDLRGNMESRHVLVVEDIVDTGLTITRLLQLFKTRNPSSIRLCAFLHKPSRSEVPVTIDYLGFTIEDKFVVGYGLDVNERFRECPDLVVYQEAK